MATKVAHKEHTCKGCGSSPLDTLAQLGTKKESEGLEDFQTSSLTTIDDRQALMKRARRKYMTGGYVLALVDAEKENESSSLRKAYWNTYHCAGTLTLKSNGKVSGKYCKNRWCLVCNSIRTAQLMKKYIPVIEEWKDKHFVTLTIPNVEGRHLKESIEVMQSIFVRVQSRMKKRAQRGSGSKLIGLRKLEVTYNPKRNDFHPHYHVIIEGKENAKLLRNYFLSEYNKSFYSTPDLWGAASFKAQDVRPADDKSVRELFKYFTKVIDGKQGDPNRVIYADALDVMFNAVKGKRVFQNFGFKAPKEQLSDEELKEVVKEAETEAEAHAVAEYEWSQDKGDWETKQDYKIDHQTGEVTPLPRLLSGYKVSDGIKELVTDRVIIRKGHSWRRWARSAPTYPNKKRECANTPETI